MTNSTSAAGYFRRAHLPYLPSDSRPKYHSSLGGTYRRFFRGREDLKATVPYVGGKRLGEGVKTKDLPRLNLTLLNRIGISQYSERLRAQLSAQFEAIGFSRETVDVAKLQRALESNNSFLQAIDLREGEERTVDNVLRAIIWRCGDEREVLEPLGIMEAESAAEKMAANLTISAGRREIQWIRDQIFDESRKYESLFLRGIFVGSAAARLKTILESSDNRPIITNENEIDFMFKIVQRMKDERGQLHDNDKSHHGQDEDGWAHGHGCGCEIESYRFLGWAAVAANLNDVARAGRIAGQVIGISYDPSKARNSRGEPMYFGAPLHLACLPLCGEDGSVVEEPHVLFLENALVQLPAESVPIDVIGKNIAGRWFSHIIHPRRIGVIVKFVADNFNAGRLSAYDKGRILGVGLPLFAGESLDYFGLNHIQCKKEIKTGALFVSVEDEAEYNRGIKDGKAEGERIKNRPVVFS